MTKRRVPVLRFKGFTDEWEQRKLLDILEQPVTDGPHETPNLVKKGIPFISAEAIINNQIDFSKKRGYISVEYNKQCNKKYAPKIYDVYMVKSGSTVGKVAILETSRIFNIWSPLAAMRVNHKNSPYFLYYLLQTDMLQEQTQNKSKGGTQPNLSMRVLEKFSTYYTNVEEEEKIANLLKVVDKLISLQQRKLRQLKLLKNALLKRMFTAKKSPTLRFRDFSKDWKLHKLQDITDRLDNARVPVTASKRIAGSTPYYGANGIQDYVKGYTHDGEFLLVAEDGANNINDYPVICAKGKIWVNNHTHVLQAKNKKIDILFLMYALKFLNMKKYLVGGGRSKLNAETMMKLALKLPELDEEHNIGVLIKNMDVLITQYKYRIQKINKFKQFLLQNMFI
ncbi:restriction endonuclease subunit S [Lactobacillus johnsonii]